eukprot:1725397-Prymnesium_polylepis.1
MHINTTSVGRPTIHVDQRLVAVDARVVQEEPRREGARPCSDRRGHGAVLQPSPSNERLHWQQCLGESTK